jgi:hypothetical protein
MPPLRIVNVAGSRTLVALAAPGPAALPSPTVLELPPAVDWPAAPDVAVDAPAV